MAICGFFDFNLHYIQMFQNLHKTTWEWGLIKRGEKHKCTLPFGFWSFPGILAYTNKHSFWRGDLKEVLMSDCHTCWERGRLQ